MQISPAEILNFDICRSGKTKLAIGNTHVEQADYSKIWEFVRDSLVDAEAERCPKW